MEIHLARPKSAQGGMSSRWAEPPAIFQPGRTKSSNAEGGKSATIDGAKAAALAGQTHGWARLKGVSSTALGFFSGAKDNILPFWDWEQCLPWKNHLIWMRKGTKAPECEVKCSPAIINIYIGCKRGWFKRPGRPLSGTHASRLLIVTLPQPRESI